MKRIKGFSLIELMIAVVIVGILVVIAVPSYQNYVIKANRAAAQAFMMDVDNRQKQYLLDARSYLDVADNSGFSDLGMSVPAEVSDFYDVTVTTSSTPPAFTITAVPIAGSKQANDDTLTLNSSGTKTPTDKW